MNKVKLDKQPKNKNLKLGRWKKGESGNPKGRPAHTNSITWWYKKLLAANEGNAAKKVAKIAIERAQEGSIQHIQEVTDRTDGRLQDTRPASQGDQYLTIVVSSDKARELVEGVSNFRIWGNPQLGEGDAEKE